MSAPQFNNGSVSQFNNGTDGSRPPSVLQCTNEECPSRTDDGLIPSFRVVRRADEHGEVVGDGTVIEGRFYKCINCSSPAEWKESE